MTQLPWKNAGFLAKPSFGLLGISTVFETRPSSDSEAATMYNLKANLRICKLAEASKIKN